MKEIIDYNFLIKFKATKFTYKIFFKNNVLMY